MQQNLSVEIRPHPGTREVAAQPDSDLTMPRADEPEFYCRSPQDERTNR